MNEKRFLGKSRFARIGKKNWNERRGKRRKVKRKDKETRKSREKRRERKEDSRHLTDDVSSSRGNKETRTFSVKRSLETVYHTDRIRVSTNTRNNYFEHSEIFCTSEHVQTTSMEGKREEGPYFSSF